MSQATQQKNTILDPPTTESSTTTSDITPKMTTSTFERNTNWRSSFHGDIYTQEDIYKVTDHVKIGFDDIFGEPFALRTGDIGSALAPHVRKIFNHVFSYSQSALYFFLTLVTGVFLGLGWGIIFGLVNYIVVWFIQPALKIVFILFRIIAMPIRAFVRAFLDPLFQAFGQVFSFISAKFRLRVLGLDYAGPKDEVYGKRPAGKAYSNASSYPQEWLGFV